MAKRRKKSRNLALQSLELIGRPTFFLFTFLVTSCYGLFVLITKLLHSIKVPKFREKRTLLKRKTWLNAKLGPAAAGRRVLIGILVAIVLCSILAFLTYWFIFRNLPSVHLLSDSPPALTTKIYDRNGVLLYQIYKDQNRSLIKLSDLPPSVVNATLAAEDKNFYHHYGFSFIGIIRAATNNITRGTTQGGSTITQQLVKNVLLSPQKSFTRKLKELVLAVETEHSYSKDQILEMYLNQVGYGGTSYGVEQASHEYFGKSAKDLNLAEAAMLAGLPIAPTTLSPFGTDPYLGKIRQQQVLEAMVTSKMITEDEKVAALATPLVFHPQDTAIRAPHFVMYIKDQLVRALGEDVVNRGGLQVTTTLDLDKQALLQSEINTELDHLTKLHVQNGAGLIVAPPTGEVLAMVGSRDFFDSEHDGQVNIVMQKRQPGSSIKPITYALAFLNGATPNSVIDDSPVCFVLRGQPDYCPRNYDNKFHGPVTIRTALASSYNIPAIKTLNTYGISKMVDLAKQLGITTWDDSSRFGLSLTLGGGEITMFDLASVYSVFANGGLKIPFKSILSVRDSQGKELSSVSTPSLPPQQILPAGIAYQINSILSDSAARAPAFGFNSVLNLPGANVAVKTGTTNDLRDNWTFGYTPDYLVATWVGNNDNSPMSSVASGITGASPIWARTMQKLLANQPAQPLLPPSSMIKINVSCTSWPRYEYFIPGTAPHIDCSATPSGTLLNSAASTSR